MQRCKVIARYGIGVDIVDVEAATARGILVTNVRDYCTEEVADHAIALWLALARKLWQYDRATHAGRLALEVGPAGPSPARPDHGHRLVRQDRPGDRRARAGPSASTSLAYDPYLPPRGVRGARTSSRLPRTSCLRGPTCVMMQVPMTAETRHFLGPAEFARMRPGAIVVNTGRGPTIDNKALYDALIVRADRRRRARRSGGGAGQAGRLEPARQSAVLACRT